MSFSPAASFRKSNVDSRCFVRGALCLTALLLPQTVHAQACLGTPNRGGIAYENVRYSVGTGHGAAAAFVPGRLAIGAHANTRTTSDATSGFEGGGRFAVVLPVSRVQVCPGIGADFYRDTWTVSGATEVKTSRLTGRAGVGIGLEQPVYKGIAIIPSVGVHYQFAATKFDAEIPGQEVVTTGDTTSKVVINYAIVARYRFVFSGVSAFRHSDGEGRRPAAARYFVGFAFGGSNGKNND